MRIGAEVTEADLRALLYYSHLPYVILTFDRNEVVIDPLGACCSVHLVAFSAERSFICPDWQADPSPTPPTSSTPLSTCRVLPTLASRPTSATRPSSPTRRAEVMSARTASRAETSSWAAPCCSLCLIQGGKVIPGIRESRGGQAG